MRMGVIVSLCLSPAELFSPTVDEHFGWYVFDLRKIDILLGSKLIYAKLPNIEHTVVSKRLA